MKKGILGLFIVISVLFGTMIITAEESSTEVQFFNSFTNPYCYVPNAFESFWVQEPDEELSVV